MYYCWDFGVTNQRDPSFGTTFKWDVDLLGGYEHSFARNYSRNAGTSTFLGLVNPGLFFDIQQWKPDAVLFFGYPWFTHLLLVATLGLLRIPLIFRGDSHFIGRPDVPVAKRIFLKLLFSAFSAITCVGNANREYYKKVGIPNNRLFFAPHSVNAVHFVKTEQRIEAARQIREKLGIGRRRALFFAGKFVPNKQPLELLRAFARVALPSQHALVFVGDGQDREAMVSEAKKHPELVIRFMPFANQSEMPSIYLAADIFILPSKGYYETWGLAVNEAMHLGTPCIVSDHVGCQMDLVTDGVTGWVFQTEDSVDMDRCIRKALEADLSSFHERVAERISRYTYRQTTAGLESALKFSLAEGDEYVL